jgi:hypothetical protein
MVPIYDWNDVEVINLFEYVMVMKVGYQSMYSHAYILLGLNFAMMNLRLLLSVMEMYVQLKMRLK